MNSHREFDGKVALITGGARGIGLGIARRLAAAGARVCLADINAPAGEAAVEALRRNGDAADFVTADLSVRGGAATMVDDAVRRIGGIDLLVNNARAGRRLSLAEECEENWDLALDVGLKAAFFASQAAIRHMAPRGGVIVNIASVAAVQATNESPSYHAAKAGLLQLTRYLAVAAGPQHVRVNCVLPGLIVQEEHRQRFASPENSGYRELATRYQPLGHVGTEEDVAEAVIYLCSDRARYVSGTCLTLDGAATVQEPFGLLLRHRTAIA